MGCRPTLGCGGYGLLDEVDRDEQAHPDDIDEVPVVGHNDGGGGLCRSELRPGHTDQHDDEGDDARDHVQCVESGGDEEDGTVHGVLDGQTLVHQLVVLVGLTEDKRGAQHDGDHVPLAETEQVTSFCREHAQLGRDRGGHEDDGDREGVRDVKEVRTPGPRLTLAVCA